VRSPSRRRPEQVGELIRKVIAEALVTAVRDPRIQLVTITRVEVSADLSYARVFVAAHGDPEAREQALEGLASAAGFFRSRVARELAARITPELRFELDKGVEHAARIDQLLAEITREGGPDAGHGGAAS
jgi:ribosome-binding factor A